MSRRTKAIALGLTVLTAGAFAAWAMHERIPLQQYRTVPAGDSIPTFDDGAELNAAVATQPVPSIEIHRKLNEYAYAIASVEFTDQGFFWDERQLWKAAAYIRDQISSGRGAVVVTFAHGWNNNAAPDNQNAACFQEVLKAVSTLQASYHGNDPAKAPAVVGVYLGWRGLVFRNVRLNQALTFWNRAKVADRIGNRGDLVETLLTLSRLRASDKKKRTKLIIVGHSFGARAVFAGLSPFYNAAFVGSGGEQPIAGASASSPTPIDEFADLVVLVNAAFSADQFSGLDRRLQRADSSTTKTNPSLIVAASVSDRATRSLYPWAYVMSSWVESFGPREDANALRLTVGNYGPFVTDTIEIHSGAPRRDAEPSSASACHGMSAGDLDIVRGRSRGGDGGLSAMAKYDTIRVFDQASRAGAASEQYSMVLRRYSPHRSVMAVAVDSRIIASHSEIFTAPFTEFLTRVVNAKAFWAQPAPTPNGPQPERTRAGAARPARTSP